MERSVIAPPLILVHLEFLLTFPLPYEFPLFRPFPLSTFQSILPPTLPSSQINLITLSCLFCRFISQKIESSSRGGSISHFTISKDPCNTLPLQFVGFSLHPSPWPRYPLPYCVLLRTDPEVFLHFRRLAFFPPIEGLSCPWRCFAPKFSLPQAMRRTPSFFPTVQ